MPDGSLVPRHGPRLRKIASDAVNYVYNHGNGYSRGREPYYSRRDELGRRFRRKYSSFVPDADEDVQGNVQPTFIGVFDTVAALGNGQVTLAAGIAVTILLALFVAALSLGWPWYLWGPLLALLGLIGFWYGKLKWSQWKYFSPNEKRPLRLSRISDWPSIWKYGHYAKWNLRNYDKWLDSDVGFARHALAIDEHRKNFPRVKWAMPAEAKKTIGRKPEWLKQVWFAGCHSDVGGSYPEPESRLSDIALQWMLEELKDCVPEVTTNSEKLFVMPDPTGMQHEETFMFSFGPLKRRWPSEPRDVGTLFPLHPTVVERLQAGPVSHLGEMRQYRPEQLQNHPEARGFYR